MISSVSVRGDIGNRFEWAMTKKCGHVYHRYICAFYLRYFTGCTLMLVLTSYVGRLFLSHRLTPELKGL